MIKGCQITIQFHVDDLKLSHVNKEVLMEEVNKINTKFRTNTQDLNITTGNVHDYFGITVGNKRKESKVKVHL